MKATALGLLATLFTATAAAAHAGHAAEGSVLHATQHASPGWLIAVLALIGTGALTAVLVKVGRRGR